GGTVRSQGQTAASWAFFFGTFLTGLGSTGGRGGPVSHQRIAMTLRKDDMMTKISVIGATLVGAAALCAAPLSLHQTQDKGLTLPGAKARRVVGRPLTPVSVAGVPRRYERRAYRGGYYGGG